jgi:signal transduction histidine kinase
MQHLITYLVYLAVLARAVGWNQETTPIPSAIWSLLAVFGIILFLQQPLYRRFPKSQPAVVLIQSAMVIAMLLLDPAIDFLPMLFLPLSFQAVQFFGSRIGFAWIGGFILVMAGLALFGMEWEAGLTLVLTGGAANMLMGSFAHLMHRTDQQQRENQRLFVDLQEAYRRLKVSVSQAEALATADERHRLTREMHDSLTQTLFSMNLAVQAAQLSVQEEPDQVESHLTRLQMLSSRAAHEVQTLAGQIQPYPISRDGLVAAIRRLADERLEQDGLKVSLQVTGNRSLTGEVEVALYRIVQEALNNITRHSGVRQARVGLWLENPTARLEVEDSGRGFDPEDSGQSTGFGLAGMRERADEINWELRLESHPGQGTRTLVEEKSD